MQYVKPPLSFEKQISLLESRGLMVANHDIAKKHLSSISYYRLSAYCYPFQQANDSAHHYQVGATFEDVLSYYLFDRELRVWLFDIIERLEIALRTQIIYQFAHAHGAWWYEDRSLFRDPSFFQKNVKKIKEELGRSNEQFIKHYFQKYSNPNNPPAWMTIEVISMGLLSKLYRNLKNSPAKKAVANHFSLPSPYILESWMHSITYVRNICAHHGRLWNRSLTLKPELLKKPRGIWLHQNKIQDNKEICLQLWNDDFSEKLEFQFIKQKT